MDLLQIYQTNHLGLYVPTTKPIYADVIDGHPLIPAGCKTTAPPVAGPRQVARALSLSTDSEWELVPNWVGVVYWLPDGSQHRIDEVGIEPPVGHLTADPGPTPAQLAATRISEIKAELIRIDSDGARPAREIAAAWASGQTPSAEAVSKVTALETSAVTLRAELASLGGGI